MGLRAYQALVNSKITLDIACPVVRLFHVGAGRAAHGIPTGPPVNQVGQGSRSELVVIFKTTPTADQIAAVRKNCPSSPGAVLEPPARNNLATSRRYPIRYDVSKASGAQKAAVYRCLGAQGVNVSEESADN